MLEEMPVLGICGFSGSGKTTLIESVLPHLIAKGLRVAVLKHDVHGIDVDRPGKDSDRFFRAGADVMLEGKEQKLLRIHGGDQKDLAWVLADLALQYDLVLVEGHKGTPIRKLWLAGPAEDKPPADARKVERVLAWDSQRRQALLAAVDELFGDTWLQAPLFALVPADGAKSPASLEKCVRILTGCVERVYIIGHGDGAGDVPRLERSPDLADSNGIVADVLTAMRWAPLSSWLAVTGSLSAVTAEAVERILSTRAPGVWATLPRVAPKGEEGAPLAYFDMRARPILEQMAAGGYYDLRYLAAHEKVRTLEGPEQRL